MHTHTQIKQKMFESRDIERDYERWRVVSCERVPCALASNMSMSQYQFYLHQHSFTFTPRVDG